MYFIPHYCIIIENAKYFFEISIFLDVLKCLIKVDVVKLKLMWNIVILGNGQTTSFEQYTLNLCTGSREEGESAKSSMPVCF